MNAERWKRLKALFTHASELPPEDRLSFLERECAGDVELLQEILEMLASAAAPGPGLKSFSPLSPRATVEPSLAGSKFADFEVERELGRGGMGVVYLARQISLDRRVALKVLLPHLAKSSDQVARFVHEAQKVAKLDHPGIVAVYSVGSEDDRHYFAMEFVPGHDLASELEALRPLAITDHVPRHLPAFDSREYIPAVVELAIQAGEALAHAHDRGVIHRDVKPRNLLLADDGRLVLVDFGLARDARFGEITHTGDVAGTPHYMSPEQAETRSRRRIDHRTDVYSLGVVLYEMLTLRRPFDGQTSIDILRQIANREPNAIERSNPRVPRDLRTICFKAMEKRPEDRYPTAREFALDLQRFQRHESIHARPPSLVRRARSFVQRRRWVIAASALVALGLGVGALVASRSVRAKDDSELCSLLESRLAIDEVSNADAQALMSADRFEAVNEGGSAELRELHARMKERFGERRGRLLHDLEALLVRAEHKPRTSLDVPAEELAPSAAEIARAVAALTAYTGSALDPTLLPKALCRIAVEVKTGTATPAFTLIVQRLDPCTGQRGRAERVVAARDAQGRFVLNLAPGPYRITAVEPGIGFAEFTRVFSNTDAEYAIAAWIRGDDEVRRTAKRIAGAKYNVHTYVAMRDNPSLNEVVGVEYELDDYDLDRTPVTCAEFARFLAETKAPRPAFWSDTSAQDWPTRPVTMIPADEAQLFAEWRGMRLPSLAEWELAVRGVGRAKFPPAISDADPTLGGLRAGVEGPKRYLPRDEGFAELRRWYAINVLPVGSSPAFVGDIKDVLGNVQEWCDTWDFDFVEGEYRGSLALRIRYGTSCHDSLGALKSKGLEFQTQAPISTAEVFCGFRCAKSARPPSVD